MDASILQLFGVEEILERIASKHLSGCFHAFVSKEAAAIFFKDGIIIAAVKGKTEGEEVLKQVLGWKEARYVWQSEAASLIAPTTAPMQIDILTYLSKPGTLTGTPAPATAKPASATGRTVIPASNKGKATGPLTSKVGLGNNSVDLTSTKTMNASAEERFAHDEALLNKHKLWLASLDNPGERHRLARVNTLAGRSPACALPIPHPSVSRQHCILQITDRGLHVKDLDTTNGTRVNGIVMKEGYINAGDKLTIGHLHFRLEKE